MNKASFYDEFHTVSNIQKGIINKRNFTYRGVISRIEGQIIKNIRKNNENIRLLDFGCGGGTLSFYFAEKGIDVTGIDISKRAINLANKSAKVLGVGDKVSFYQLGEGKSKLKNKKYDVILCLEVIEHVEKDKELIKSLSKKLDKKGILIISTPLISAPLNRLGLTDAFDKKVGHLRRYSTNELVRYLDSLSGTKVVEYVVTEGILRNSLYIFPFLEIFIRFIRGPLSDLVTFFDFLSIKLFGGSNIFIVIKKK